MHNKIKILLLVNFTDSLSDYLLCNYFKIIIRSKLLGNWITIKSFRLYETYIN